MSEKSRKRRLDQHRAAARRQTTKPDRDEIITFRGWKMTRYTAASLRVMEERLGYELSIVQIGSRWKVLIIPRRPDLPWPGHSESSARNGPRVWCLASGVLRGDQPGGAGGMGTVGERRQIGACRDPRIGRPAEPIERQHLPAQRLGRVRSLA